MYRKVRLHAVDGRGLRLTEQRRRPRAVRDDLVDVATGAMRRFGPAGLRPGDGSWTWMDDGSLVEYRPAGTQGGDPGVYLVAPDGGARKVFGSGTLVGVAHA